MLIGCVREWSNEQDVLVRKEDKTDKRLSKVKENKKKENGTVTDRYFKIRLSFLLEFHLNAVETQSQPALPNMCSGYTSRCYFKTILYFWYNENL